MHQSGPYTYGARGLNAQMSPQWPSQPFPPVPLGTPPATLPYPRPPSIPVSQRPSTPLCSPTQPCSPGTPSFSPSQPRSTGSPHVDNNSPSGVNEAPRTYGFDLNTSWQSDKDHYDNQKINGLTFPRTIRQSAFTQRLNIEGCDPLALPVAALLYQQANNNWLRKLAHGREVYLIPTGGSVYDGVANSVEKQIEASTWTESPTIGPDRMAKCWTRQKTMNTKYAAQQIAEIIQGWLPARVTDPDSQHEITQLRNQLAQLKQQLGGEPSGTSNPSRPPPSSSSPAGTAIGRALHGHATNPSAPHPPTFDPCCLLTVPPTTNQWLLDHLPSTLAIRTFNKWLKELPISDTKRNVLNTNLAKMVGTSTLRSSGDRGTSGCHDGHTNH